ISLNELIEPLDFEEFLQQHQTAIYRDPLRSILDFPLSDITLNLIERKLRTVNYVMPKEDIVALPHYVQHCIGAFTRPFKVVEFSQRHHSSSTASRNRLERTVSVYHQEFEIDQDYDLSSLDETLVYQSESCTPSSRQSIASLSSVSTLVSSTDTLTPRGSWASFDLRNSANDPLIDGILERNIQPENVDQINEAKRLEERQDNLFSLYPNLDTDDVIEKRPPAKMPHEHIGNRIFVKCHQLKLELEFEPIFASMALYDAKEKKKLSENFYFDLNSESLNKMLTSHVLYADTSSKARSAIFEITNPSHDLFLVIRLEKILQGDSLEAYSKDKEDKEKYIDKLKSSASDYCERLGKYRQPFAWTGIYLNNIFNGESYDDKSDRDSIGTSISSNSLDRKSSTSSFEQIKRRAVDMGTLSRRGSLERSRSEKRRSWSPEDFAHCVENFRAICVTVSSFFKQEPDKMRDEELFKLLPELKRPSSVIKRYKSIPGSIKLEISPYPDDLKNCLTPDLAKVVPFVDENVRPVKEILEFPIVPILNPHYAYRNLLYINPKELNFSAARAGQSARNIAIRIQLMAGEKQSDAMNLIFGKSSCPEFSSEAYTVVNYHNKCPVFYDEIKILLPAEIRQNHHILFTIFHISCQKKEGEPKSVETPIGYTWLPIIQDSRLNIGEHALPVMIEEPPVNYAYIPPVQLPGTKWLDNHRPVFTVTVEASTAIHTLDEYLDKFFCLCECLESKKIPAHIGESNIEKELKNALGLLKEAESVKLVKNLQIVFDKLIELFVTTYKIGGQILTLAPMVFESICQLLEKLSNLSSEQYGRQILLSTYIQYQCKIPHPLEPKLTGTGPHDELNRSSSNPDLYFASVLSGKMVERNASIRSDYSPTGIGPRDGLVRLLHEELALHWVVASGSAATLSLTNSWMLFELIIKSMIEHLHVTNNLQSNRKTRFPHSFTDDISTLVNLITTKIIGYHSTDTKLASSINASLAFFMFDLLSIMDRGFVFCLVKIYYKLMTSKNASIPDLIHYKIDFLRILCSHEHIVALNLPFATPFTTISGCSSPTPSVTSSNSGNSFPTSDKALYAELTPEYRAQHFLIGLVLGELIGVMELSNSDLHGKSIRALRDLLASHDTDPRLVEPDAKARVAVLYLPLLGIVMDIIPQLHSFLPEDHDRMHTIGLLEDYQGPTGNVTDTISPEVAYAISGSRMYNFVQEPIKKVPLSSLNTRHLLACFLWVIKNVEKTILNKWISGLTPHRMYQMLQVLNVCIPCFEYKGRKKATVRRAQTQSFRKTPDMKDKLEEYIRGTGSARNDLMNRRKDRNSTEKYRFKKDQMPYRTVFYDYQIKVDNEMESNQHIDGTLATEVSLTILDTLELITLVAFNTEIHNSILGTVMKVLLHSLSRNQSVTALQNLFATQRSIIYKSHNLLFDDESDNCADLCFLLLKHCGSQLTSVRSQAAASLYLLMRQTFEIGSNFPRVKMQITLSLSSLVGTSSSFSEDSLRKALKTILVYAETDSDLQDTTFPEQVQDLLFNLHMILSDTVKMKEYQEDPEMLLDLMNRIAKGYQNSPDLRLTWLENMAKKHNERNNYTEAAMCYVHSASLVAEYLSMLDSQNHLPIGAVSFSQVSPNTLMESAVSDDVISPGDDGIVLGNRFTEVGLKTLLEEAANSFQIAGMYEAMNDVYRILIPIYEANREFQKLSKLHGKLQEAFNRIAQLNGKRLFGTYFRVGFYGQKFGDLDQQEFIYKEPTLTKLSEIFSRLQNFYSERFGPDVVHIIKDSNSVSVDTLDPDKAYIQITYVEPYFEPYELRQRETYFERNFNIKRFIFATPFTKSGKAHGELQEQYKRKTIVTTSEYFPYVKTRIQVTIREQIILEPIEVAIEDIQKKTLELAAATNQEPSDPKILQMVLQGCIGTQVLLIKSKLSQYLHLNILQVNQGPLEMALTFLQNISDGVTIPSKHQNKLRLCFKDFSK
ncbi:unnamed protein product, partial [Sphagnum compactum]